eukprot:5278682-Lingulodinium_polyedra.AAC.1
MSLSPKRILPRRVASIVPRLDAGAIDGWFGRNARGRPSFALQVGTPPGTRVCAEEHPDVVPAEQCRAR